MSMVDDYVSDWGRRRRRPRRIRIRQSSLKIALLDRDHCEGPDRDHGHMVTGQMDREEIDNVRVKNVYGLLESRATRLRVQPDPTPCHFPIQG